MDDEEVIPQFVPEPLPEPHADDFETPPMETFDYAGDGGDCDQSTASYDSDAPIMGGSSAVDPEQEVIPQ